MDPMSLLFVRAFVDSYLSDQRDKELRVVEVGSLLTRDQATMFGTFRKLFENPLWEYIGVDVENGYNVDIVLSNPHRWYELNDELADVVLSCSMLEHVEYPWEIMHEIHRILKPGGLFCLVVPSSGFEHKFPRDCWRILPDGVRALAKWCGLNVVEIFVATGVLPWEHTFSVMSKPGTRDFDNKMAGLSAYLSAIEVQQRDDHILTPKYFLNSSEILLGVGNLELAEAYVRKGLELHPENAELKRRALNIYRQNGNLTRGMEIALTLVNSPSDNKISDLSAVSSFASDLARLSTEMFMTREGMVIFERFFEVLSNECRKFVENNIHYVNHLAKLSEDIGFWLLCEECWNKISTFNLDLSEFLRAKLMWAVMPRGYGFKELSKKRFDEILEYQMRNRIVNRTTVIQHLINKMGYKTYVEIGVERGLNFLQIKCPMKFAVDVKFKIPGGFEDTPTCRFFQMSSDEFFSNIPQELLVSGIDIALIDGSHTYRQSLKDLLNCLRYLNENGTIILHDCLPISESCAAATMEEAAKYRDFTGAWSGQVYKTIINIRRNPKLFVAVLDVDFGVGIVRKDEAENTIEMEDEEIESLTFYHLMNDRERLLNLKSAEWFWEFLSKLR